MSSPHDISEVRSNRRKIISVVVLLVLLTGILVMSLWPKNRAVVRNASNGVLKNVTLELHATRGDWSTIKSTETVNPGESFDIRHSNDSVRAELRFEIAGQEFQYQEEHFDYYSSDTFFFEIQPDGVVKSGIDKGTDH